MLHSATPFDDEQLRGSPARTPALAHGCAASRRSALLGNEANNNARISAAASSGRLKVVGSQSGTANLCSGVSMSPGSSDRNEIPSPFASSAHIAVRCRRAALLE